MRENILDNASNLGTSDAEFKAEKLSVLSKSEIWDLIRQSPDSKNEILRNIPDEVYWPKRVDQNALESSEFSLEYGFKVGSVEVRDASTGKAIELGLYCERRKSEHDSDGQGQIMPDKIRTPNSEDCDPRRCSYRYHLVDRKGKTAGIMDVKNYPENLVKKILDNYSEKSVKKEYEISKNLLIYGDDSEERPKSFIHVDTMQSFAEDRYKGCGTVLHQVAVEHSLREGFEGRAQLYADYVGSSSSGNEVVTSTGFHENFGYLYKDIYDYDKEDILVRRGEEIHAALAESRWEEAEKWKKEHPGEKITGSIRDNYRPLASQAALVAYLPEYAILREKERMLERQNLQMNRETFEALERKYNG